MEIDNTIKGYIERKSSKELEAAVYINRIMGYQNFSGEIEKQILEELARRKEKEET